MLSTRSMQETLGVLLLIGTLLSAAIVTLGGGLYLIQHGHMDMATEIIAVNADYFSIKQILWSAFSFAPLSLITLGLFVLVFIQILRVALLAYFYAQMRDYWFTSFSIFILGILIYSFNTL